MDVAELGNTVITSYRAVPSIDIGPNGQQKAADSEINLHFSPHSIGE